MSLSVLRLKELLHYCPDSGAFTWAKKSHPKMTNIVGSIAGAPDHEGYLLIRIDKKLYKAHRLAWFYMTSEWPEHQIDHINGIAGDNRWSNLRPATSQQNIANRGAGKANTSGVKGVGWDKERGKWRARIMVNGKEIQIGRFEKFEEAVAAYHAAAIAHFGEYARIS